MRIALHPRELPPQSLLVQSKAQLHPQTHKFNSEAADRRRQMAPSGCACKQCGVVSNHTPKHFQQMECLCDDCYTALYVATELEFE